jgi:hypothetical protein
MKSIITTAFAIAVSVAAFAQHHGHQRNGERFRGHAEKLKTELNLTEEQYASVRRIDKRFSAQIMNMRRGTTLKRNDIQGEVRSIRKQHRVEIEQVLNADQKEKWMNLRKERKDRIHMERKQIKHQGKRMQEELKLTEEQSMRMEKQRAVFQQRASAIRNTSGLSEEKKKAEINLLRSENERIVKQILSEEQFRKWQELRKLGTDKKGKLRKKHHFREKQN